MAAAASRSMELPGTFAIASVGSPDSRARRSAASVSEVSPDCEMTSTDGLRGLAVARVPHSLAYSTSTARPQRSSRRISAARPAWRLEPLATISTSPRGLSHCAMPAKASSLSLSRLCRDRAFGQWLPAARISHEAWHEEIGQGETRSLCSLQRQRPWSILPACRLRWTLQQGAVYKETIPSRWWDCTTAPCPILAPAGAPADRSSSVGWLLAQGWGGTNPPHPMSP